MSEPQVRHRILLTTHSLPRGGAEKVFVTLASALNEKHDVHCHIPCFQFGDPGMRQRLRGISVSYQPRFTRLGYKVFYKARQIIRNRFPGVDIEARLEQRTLKRLHAQQRFDIVNTHLYMATLHSCLAFRDSAVKIVESDHGHYAFLPEREKPAASAIFDRLDALIYPAGTNARFSSDFPWNPKRITRTIPYGSESSPSQGKKKPLPSNTSVQICMVARGVEEKGWIEAVAGCRLARELHKVDLHLHLVGEGPCVEKLQDQSSVPEDSWITFHGHVDPPDSLLTRMDLALLPTFLPGESLPNSVIEYLRHGLPVVATPAGGIPEMLQTASGNAGILIPQDSSRRADVSALAEAIARLASDSALYSRTSERAIEAGKRYSIQAYTEAYEQLFSDLLER